MTKDVFAIPASVVQQRLWTFDRSDRAFLNIHAVIRLIGQLDVATLEESLSEVVSRHESLRTAFEVRDGKPFQVIAPSLHVRFEKVDLSGSEQSSLEAEVRRHAEEEAQRPFDPAHGPLLRATLLRLGADEHVALVTMHPLIGDGWSLGVLVRELATLYDAHRRGGAASLPEPPQYAGYAARQAEWLSGEEYAAQLTYWKAQLPGAEGVPELPTDKPRSDVQTYRRGRQELLLPERLSGAVKDLSRGEGATLFTTLLAAFQSLLHRYTGQRDVSVGVPVAGRDRDEFENLVGRATNTLVMRADLSGNPSFRELLARARAVTLGAYENQSLPFEKLVEELQPRRDLGRSSLFQVMFALDNTRRATHDAGGLKFEAVIADGGAVEFDLALWMDDTGETLTGTLEYNADLFGHSTAERMLGQYITLLESVVTDPDRRLSELPMAAGAGGAKRCVHELIEEQARRTPDAIAVVFEGEELTYAQLDERAERLAGHLRAAHVGADVRVGICVERSAEMVVGLLGILKAGGAYVPLDPASTNEHVAFVLEDAQARTLLTQGHLTDSLPPHGATVVLLDDETSWSGGDNGDAPHASPGSLAYVIYAPGAEGRARGVMITHDNVSNFFKAVDERLGGGEPGTWLALTDITSEGSVLELFWTLARGFKVVVQRDVAAGAGVEASARKMDFSLFYFASDEDEGVSEKYRLLVEGARFADRHGFAAVWTPERHFHAFGGVYPNPSVTSAALAAITERLQIRAGSVVLPLHSPIRVAEEWAFVDNLSHGRVGVSFASGWHENDFVLAPDNYAERKEIMIREIETLRRLWRGESVRARGGTGREVEVSIRPRPVQKELPVWLTAAGNPETFRIAGEIGAGLLTHLLGQTVKGLAEKIAVYRESWQRHQPGWGEGYVTLMIHTFVGEDREEVRETVRVPFSNYLKSSVDLMRGGARGAGGGAARAYTEEDMKILLTHAFDRYFETSGLFGTPDDCLRMVEQLRSIGVDELACLIDFGVETETVLSSLRHLDLVRRRSKSRERAADEEFSVPAQLVRHGVTHLQCTPSLARTLLADSASRDALKGLRMLLLLLNGEALPAELRAELSAEVFVTDGTTERGPEQERARAAPQSGAQGAAKQSEAGRAKDFFKKARQRVSKNG
jgi:natural product biosynthesis luciferase-like monooxygenase protein